MQLLELAERKVDGVVVRLLWDRDRDQTVLRYVDFRSGDAFRADVPNDEALSAFHHPNTYRPRNA
jgi:hypothetical protein